MWAGMVQMAGEVPGYRVERTKVPVGRLHDPALFAPWRVMWRSVFPGCHTHSGGLHAALERIMGIEPTFAAWEAAVLPMNYIRVAPCRNCTGAPLRERRACTYGPRLEGRRILRAASAPLVSETGVEPGNKPNGKACSRGRLVRVRDRTIFAHAVLEFGGCR